MNGLTLENFTEQQGVYNLMFNNLDDQSLGRLAQVSKKFHRLVNGYNLPGAISRISFVARDFLERLVRATKAPAMQPANAPPRVLALAAAIDKSATDAFEKAQATSTQDLLSTVLALPNAPTREAFLSKPWHNILDTKQRNYYLRLNRLFEGVFTIILTHFKNNRNDPNFNPMTALATLVTELSKKQDQKQVSNPVIEDAVVSILTSVGTDSADNEEAFRALVRFELAKLEPEADLDFEQTLREFEQVITETFDTVKPLYTAYLTIYKKLCDEGVAKIIAEANAADPNAPNMRKICILLALCILNLGLLLYVHYQ